MQGIYTTVYQIISVWSHLPSVGAITCPMTPSFSSTPLLLLPGDFILGFSSEAQTGKTLSRAEKSSAFIFSCNKIRYVFRLSNYASVMFCEVPFF